MAGGTDGLDGGVTTNGRALEAATRMGAWLKHNISFPPDVLALMQRPGLDHELAQDPAGSGDWWVTPIKVPALANISVKTAETSAIRVS
jgi:hypothetical protein